MRSLDQLLDWASHENVRDKIEKIVVVGGAQLFEETLFHPWFSTLHLTLVEQDFPCDTWLSERMVKQVKRLLAETQSDDIATETSRHTENGVSYR